MMNPLNQALAFRIWAYATPKGWDVTAVEIAEALEVSIGRVYHILAAKGWNARTRSIKGENIYATIGVAARSKSYGLGMIADLRHSNITSMES